MSFVCMALIVVCFCFFSVCVIAFVVQSIHPRLPWKGICGAVWCLLHICRRLSLAAQIIRQVCVLDTRSDMLLLLFGVAFTYHPLLFQFKNYFRVYKLNETCFYHVSKNYLKKFKYRHMYNKHEVHIRLICICFFPSQWQMLNYFSCRIHDINCNILGQIDTPSSDLFLI